MINLKRIVIALTLITSGIATAEDAPKLNKARTVVLDGAMGANVETVVEAIDKLSKESKKPIDIVIDSPGGSVVPGFWLINKMEEVKEQGIRLRCFVPRMAASMAFQTLVHCNERYTLDRSFLLWHGGRVGLMFAVVTEEVAKGLYEDLHRLNLIIKQELYATLTDLSKEEIDKHFLAETLHVGTDLARIAPNFIKSYKTIPGLMEILKDKSVPHATPVGKEEAKKEIKSDKANKPTLILIYTKGK